ncbi:flagellar hook-length control protein FliK [Marinomonas rhizomae]|uniref:Flagellar hook-length control protein FliK n=1 Tax=Marinomonas rhizomae TaxID=491948 RepID=A0A366J5U6_9GAMM|nr:flagellar hook-length control protein FliK [Marinomonas rhizomae]RBP81780.1 flagellar hook-length control protein FliK [Marinomonas rhizomae]RNF72903.1 flagellar hook-length control protein FliK [Marinomonas rhizomae]
MRTDSNTILSLPSGVPPKKPTVTKSSNDGATFANDFNKAKAAISSKESSKTEGASTSSSSVASTTSSTTSETKADENIASVSDNDGGAKVDVADGKTKTLESNVAVKESGKALQQEGESLPVDDSPDAVSDSEDQLLSNVLPKDLEGGAKPPVQLNLVGSQDSAGNSPALHTIGNEKNNVVELSVDVVNAKGTLIPEASDDAQAGVVSLSAIKRGDSKDGNNTASSTLVELSDKALVDGVDPFSNSIDDAAENELSWVLSQMGPSGAKAVTTESVGNAALDTAKTMVSAGVMAATVDKQNRSEALPSSLLAGADVSLSSEMDLDSAESILSEDGALINEPIELRKKEHEAMLSRMAAQIDGGLGDDGSSGGLNSSLHNNVNRPAVAAAALNAPTANPQANNLAMSLPPGHPGWANEMSQKVAWVAREGGHTAHIRLDPPELGSLTVKVSVDSDSNTQISFVAATPQARDLLEGQMGRLREMLAQQGMDLSRADVDVSQQDTSGAQYRENNPNGGSPQGSLTGNDDLDEELIPGNLSYVSASGVDYYA